MAEFNPEWLARVPEPHDREPQAGDELITASFQAGIRRLEQSGQLELSNVWYWTNRLNFALAEVGELLAPVRFTSRLAVGFIEELDGAFGLIGYTEPPPENDFDEPSTTDRFDEPAPRFESRRISVDGLEFPVVIRQTSVEVQWCTSPQVTAPSTARATCWVRSPTRRYQGWLIPRHAVRSLRDTVRFSDGGTGKVIDHFGQCLDAVVVSTDVPPAGLVQAQVCWPLVPGRGLVVTDRLHSHVPIRVVDVDLNLGILSDLVFPIRFSTDWTGVAGQSGALMIDPVLGEPAGAYLGITHPSVAGYLPPGMSTAPSAAGFAQSCFQLEKIAGMEFYL